jgi:hypothetical protein
MKSFHELRKEIGEYMSPEMMKKMGVENPLSGKKYPYQQEDKVVCPKCDGEGCEHCDDKGYHLEEAKAFRDFDVPASPEMKKHIESGKAKILLNVQSVLGPTTRFVVIVNPKFRNAKVSGQDKVLMFTISDPKRGRIKMFAFHGSHITHQKAMQFAKNNKLVSTKDAKGNPLYAKESVELDEVTVRHHNKPSGRQLKDPKKEVMVVDKKGKVIVIDRKNLKSYERKGWNIAESVELDEAKGITFVFPDDRKAKQFDLDIENSSIGMGSRIGNKVTVTGITSRWRAAVKKAMLKSKGKITKESVELDEALTLASDDLSAVKKTAQKLARQSPDRTYYVVQNTKIHGDGKMKRYEVVDSVDMHLYRHEKRIVGYGKSVKESVELGESASRETETAKKIAKKGKKLGDWVGKSYYEYEGNLWVLGGYGSEAVNRGPINKAKKTLNKSLLKKLKFNESVEHLDEDNTAAIARQVKQAVKKHVKGRLTVRSKGGKTRFIMVAGEHIDNELRKKVLAVVAPKANVRDKSDISYGNISDRIISASVEQWVKALGLKETKRFNEFKEEIANTAGSGAVAGLGDEPPVSKAAQKKKQRGATGDIARRKSIPAPKKGDLMPPALGEEVETFAGCRVFEVDDEEYGNATYGRKKWERWNKKFDMNKENNQMIKTYAGKNPGKPVVIKNSKTGDMSYLINKNY